MRRFVAVSLWVALMIVAAMPASAVPHPDATFRTERVYFHCVGDVKLQNAAAAQGSVFPWNTTPPSASVQDGAGCGHVEYGMGGEGFDAIFQGTFTGNLENLTVSLHEMAHSDLQPFGTEVLVTLEVDGIVRLDHTAAQLLPVTSENSGVTNAATFSITGLGYNTEAFNGTKSRTFKLTIGSPIRGASFWVWDTSEVPAGITFNQKPPAPPLFPAS